MTGGEGGRGLPWFCLRSLHDVARRLHAKTTSRKLTPNTKDMILKNHGDGMITIQHLLLILTLVSDQQLVGRVSLFALRQMLSPSLQQFSKL